MTTFHIHIKGQVQGVGFRPYVFRLATRLGLNGHVSNGVNGVHIILSGDTARIQEFYRFILSQPPANAEIRDASIDEIDSLVFSDFQITTSSDEGKVDVLLTPDIAICKDCRNELWKTTDRRQGYGFITCLHCGPRYSIISELPYDRERTTMKPFEMCSTCETEYKDAFDRRFYSQTNSCPDCAVKLQWLDHSGNLLESEQHKCVDAAVEALGDENIIAVKGIGGMLLMVDATSEKAIENLRERKNRPEKPFALLYCDENMLRNDVMVNHQSLEAWHSKESPIVLFKLKPHPQNKIRSHSIAPGLDSIGIMKPYAPILELISKKFGKPLIATSGNVTNSPICYENETALRDLRNIVDNFLINDRDIVLPQDDSVLYFSEYYKHPIILRRSRGYAPNLKRIPNLPHEVKTLCMGAMLKSAFAMLVDRDIYISQYLGNTMSYDTQLVYEHVLNHLATVFNYKAEAIVVDKHPEYFSTRKGQELSERLQLPIMEAQHHKAHFAAVLAENDLLHSDEPILGVIWDGTGYGDDGAIWGGEHFIYRHKEMYRAEHLDYFTHILGDKMSREPRVSALSIAREIPEAELLLKHKFTDHEWKLFNSYLSERVGLPTSSMGRFFDGIASLLDICDRQSYEGEAAMRLQTAASYGYKISHKQIDPYPIEDLSIHKVAEAVIHDVHMHIPVNIIAARFHATLARWIRISAEKLGVRKVAFSGGVFQNGLLIDIVMKEMENDFELYFHKQLSPNDENIAFGQLVLAQLAWEHRTTPNLAMSKS